MILITGASGFLGGRLQRDLAGRDRVVGTCRGNRKEGCESLDLADLDAVDRLLERLRPAAVIHAAAISEPDACLDDPAKAWLVNRDVPARIARGCAELGARFIHFSSDLVFAGRKPMQVEDDLPEPLSLYGQTKAESERRVLEACPKAAVLRVSSAYGRSRGGRPSFTDTLFDQLSRGETMRAMTDQWRTPTAAAQLAGAVGALLDRPDLGGVFHWGSPDRVSRYEFCLRFCAAFGFDPDLVVPCKLADLKFRSPRPHDSSLSSARLAKVAGFGPWGLDEGFARLQREYTRRAGPLL